MAKINNDKYRFDVICPKSNALSLITFCKSNGISINSMINHLIVSFLLNKNKYAFNFVDENEFVENQVNNQQKNTLHVENNEDDNENFPDIIKELLENKDNGDNLDYSF